MKKRNEITIEMLSSLNPIFKMPKVKIYVSETVDLILNTAKREKQIGFFVIATPGIFLLSKKIFKKNPIISSSISFIDITSIHIANENISFKSQNTTIRISTPQATSLGTLVYFIKQVLFPISLCPITLNLDSNSLQINPSTFPYEAQDIFYERFLSCIMKYEISNIPQFKFQYPNTSNNYNNGVFLLKKEQISDPLFQPFMLSLAFEEQTKELEINDDISISQLFLLCSTFFSLNKYIKKVTFLNPDFTNAKFAFESTFSVPRLFKPKELSFKYCNLASNGESFFESLSKINSEFTSLEFIHCAFDKNSIHSLFDAINSNDFFHSIENLHFTNISNDCCLLDEIDRMCRSKWLNWSQSMRKICLMNCNINASFLMKSFLFNDTGIKIISFKQCPFLDPITLFYDYSEANECSIIDKNEKNKSSNDTKNESLNDNENGNLDINNSIDNILNHINTDKANLNENENEDGKDENSKNNENVNENKDNENSENKNNNENENKDNENSNDNENVNENKDNENSENKNNNENRNENKSNTEKENENNESKNNENDDNENKNKNKISTENVNESLNVSNNNDNQLVSVSATKISNHSSITQAHIQIHKLKELDLEGCSFTQSSILSLFTFLTKELISVSRLNLSFMKINETDFDNFINKISDFSLPSLKMLAFNANTMNSFQLDKFDDFLLKQKKLKALFLNGSITVDEDDRKSLKRLLKIITLMDINQIGLRGAGTQKYDFGRHLTKFLKNLSLKGTVLSLDVTNQSFAQEGIEFLILLLNTTPIQEFFFDGISVPDFDCFLNLCEEVIRSELKISAWPFNECERLLSSIEDKEEFEKMEKIIEKMEAQFISKFGSKQPVFDLSKRPKMDTSVFREKKKIELTYFDADKISKRDDRIVDLYKECADTEKYFYEEPILKVLAQYEKAISFEKLEKFKK